MFRCEVEEVTITAIEFVSKNCGGHIYCRIYQKL
jgi:hypothetical protein